MTLAPNLPQKVCVVGGGRWARTIARILVKILPCGSELNLCSISNEQGWLDALPELSSDHLAVSVGRFEDALARADIELVLVARSARENAGTALAALRAGKRVFVEKPFALSEASALQVVHASAPGRCVTGLVFLLAPNLHRFRDQAKALGKLTHIDVEWLDPASEIRYAETKSYDPSVNCLPDSFPHIWSVLRLFEPRARFDEIQAISQSGGRIVSLNARLADMRATVKIARDTSSRRRVIRLEGEHGRASLDFSKEPGQAEINGGPIDVEQGYSSPLTLELQAFLGSSEPQLARVENAIESIVLVDRVLGSIREQQAHEIIESFGPEADATAANYALREISLDILGGRNASPDHQQLVTLLRSWLGGQVPEAEIPAQLRDAPALASIRKALASRAIS
ncbi:MULTISPECIES: Gfo/Idh/MocA family protein [Mesorhizobium]|uniref:Gfo/Idh/MocA-like oxidoreductase N-terminal domain-containing protein n=1 Tax=Mesorhizobium denitrificans TaxID=2294114 RepID=A0A371X8Y3_9HYPH|nr:MULTISPECIES: Gfo/Idh/MocA family oxidoreductase [Mesorhizobium]RFC65685.1 hypothetical protein DY251_16720 [Mesorhizobium denitrificans]